jgi:hypothetical protein
MDKRYRVVPPLQGIQPASALLGRIFTEVPAERPSHPTCYEGERSLTIYMNTCKIE